MADTGGAYVKEKRRIYPLSVVSLSAALLKLCKLCVVCMVCGVCVLHILLLARY